MYFRSHAAYTDLGFRRDTIARFSVLVFIPAWSRTTENPSMHIEDTVPRMQAAPNRPRNQTIVLAAPSSDTLVDSAVTVYPRGPQSPAREGFRSGLRAFLEMLSIFTISCN